MSWMDSWSRPNKHAATPPPLYLTVGDSVPYCHTCGRVISERRKTHGNSEVKYCSTRCRNNKPGPIDHKIEATFAALLEGASPEQLKAEQETNGEKDTDQGKLEGPGKDAKKHKKKNSKSMKGDHRPIIDCQVVEELVFHREKDPEKVYGRRKNRRPRFVVEKPEDWRSVDMVDTPTHPVSNVQHETATDSDSLSDSEDPDDEGGVSLEPLKSVGSDELPDAIEYGYGGGKIRPPQSQNDVNGSVGGEKGWAERVHETDEMKEKRREGQRRADEREMVRKAARRGCAFGFVVRVEGDVGDSKGRKGGKGKGGREDEEKITEERRKCEAVMKGVVVEASFAKGEWGVRWRERV